MDFSQIKESLHDATLDFIKFSWQKGQSCFVFNLHETNTLEGNRLFLFCMNVSNIEIPRYFEWGESNSVNEIWLEETHTLKVEMQSGDIIVVEGEKYIWEITKELAVK